MNEMLLNKPSIDDDSSRLDHRHALGDCPLPFLRLPTDDGRDHEEEGEIPPDHVFQIRFLLISFYETWVTSLHERDLISDRLHSSLILGSLSLSLLNGSFIGVYLNNVFITSFMIYFISIKNVIVNGVICTLLFRPCRGYLTLSLIVSYPQINRAIKSIIRSLKINFFFLISKNDFNVPFSPPPLFFLNMMKIIMLFNSHFPGKFL